MAKLPFKLNLFSGVALLFLAIGLWQAYSPLLRDRDGVIALTRSVEPLTAEQVIAKVKAARGKPTIVYFYASWCDTCRVTTPTVASYVRNQRFGNVNMLAIAVENDAYSLAAYLNKKSYDGLWAPYYIRELSAELEALSPKATQGIPLLLAFDARGKLHTSLQGSLRASELDAIIETLSNGRP
jgi:thiol:disulfide interchange protein